MGLRRKKGCNMSKWKKGLAITAGSFTLIAVGAGLAGGNDSTSSTPAKHDRPAATSQATETEAPKSVKKELREEQKQNPEPEEIEVTPEMVVDMMYVQDPRAENLFCASYDLVGDASFKSFAHGYGKPAPGTPSARAVFNEAADRC
jgi:hypothetical protein